MTPERYRRIAELYDRVVDLPPDERRTFLEASCADDPTLLQDVRSLLSLDEQAEDFLETPAALVAARFMAEEATLPAGSTLGFYRIISSLGAGGMGEVYLAEDTRLGRKIALKLLPARFTQDSNRLRWFEQEARAASGLNHPNIITIHDIGQVEDCHFIATEFVEGHTLREKMEQGPMKIDEALEVAIQVGNALAAAHHAGVVHRDIKPENIMLRTDGFVKVLDFGLAKLSQAPETSAETKENITAPGVVVGTARYMSPEQARGQRVDPRSDIFSLGVVFYEMLAGRSPFTGPTAADVTAAILRHEPPIERDFPRVPEALKRILTRSLRKERDARYPTVREMVVDLKELKQHLETDRRSAGNGLRAESLIGKVMRHKSVALLLIVLMALIVAGVLYLPMPTDRIDSIAILPLVNETGAPEVEYLSEGISDSLINRLLTEFPGLNVSSLSATLPYKGKTINPTTVGRELNVRVVVRGWLMAQGDSLSIRMELVDTRDNRRIWGEHYDNGRLSELLQLQDEIVRDLSGQLHLQSQPVKHETENPEAYVLYLKGRFEWDKVTDERLQKSIGFFLEAKEKDPNYGLAYSGLADAYSLLGETSLMPPNEAFSNAKLYAEKALELDKKLAEAWVSLGIVELFHEWNWKKAEAALKEARKLRPNNPQVYHFYAHYLQFMGRPSEAVEETKQGLGLARESLLLNAELGWAYYCARQYDRAIEQGYKTLRMDPQFSYASWTIAQALEAQHRYQEALDELEKARGPSSDWVWIVADIGYVKARLGKKAEAQMIIRDLQLRKRDYIDPVLIAYIYIALDDRDEAFRWLEKAYVEKASLLPWVKVEPKANPLREDARFIELMQRLAL